MVIVLNKIQKYSNCDRMQKGQQLGSIFSFVGSLTLPKPLLIREIMNDSCHKDSRFGPQMWNA